MKEKSPRQDRGLMCVLARSWENSPRDERRNQNGTIRFLEKPLRENVERSDVSPLLGLNCPERCENEQSVAGRVVHPFMGKDHQEK